MRKVTKIWMIAAAVLTFVGCVIFFGVMTVLGWDFSKLSTMRYVTNRYEIGEPYTNITVVADTADVALVPVEGDGSAVVCFEQEKVTHTVSVKDGTLMVEVKDTRAWYEHIAVTFRRAKVEILLPQGQYGALSVKSATGDVEVPEAFSFERVNVAVSTGHVRCSASAVEEMCLRTSTGDVTACGVTCGGDMTVNVSTGKAVLRDVTCLNFSSDGSTGDVQMEDVTAAQRMSVQRSTGDVRMVGCDAAEMYIKTTTGNVTGSVLSGKIFVAASDTGRVRVPESIDGGRCEIVTGTGNIEITSA